MFPQFLSASGSFPFGCRLSRDPFSYRYLVNTMVTKPGQSAIAFPKNEPMWVEGSERV
jgi:hypothetical protein